MRRLVFVTLVLAGCTRATPDPGATKDPSSTPAAKPPATPAVASSPPPSVASSTATTATATTDHGPPSGEIDKQFVDEAKKIFASYKAWGRVDDEMRWAPWLCRMPLPARPHMSVAEDGGHARKLYSLFAKDHAGYVSLGAPNAKPAAADQTIVKESWVPELVKDAGPAQLDHRGGSSARTFDGEPEGGNDTFGGIERDHFHRFAREGDKLYRASALAGVYMMFKKPPSTSGTDRGWVYATLTPAGEVTSAGKVASCMGCHASAKHERLFGRSAGK